MTRLTIAALVCLIIGIVVIVSGQLIEYPSHPAGYLHVNEYWQKITWGHYGGYPEYGENLSVWSKIGVPISGIKFNALNNTTRVPIWIGDDCSPIVFNVYGNVTDDFKLNDYVLLKTTWHGNYTGQLGVGGPRPTHTNQTWTIEDYDIPNKITANRILIIIPGICIAIVAIVLAFFPKKKRP